ncbi:aminotransferase-like domain-containing protein [Alishewanella longhuensis]
MAGGFRYQQLTQQLQRLLTEGYWQTGERLPSIRALCQQYQLSLATVQHALHQLEAQGLLEARARSGYYVCAQKMAMVRGQASGTELGRPGPVSVPELFFDIMNRSAAFDIQPKGPVVKLPHLTLLHRLLSRTLREQGTRYALHYDEPLGFTALREQLALHYRQCGLRLDNNELCITAGCQHALFLALQAVCRPGDIVAVEHPAFYGVLQLLQQLQLQVLEIPTDHDGMDITALQHALASWPIKACVVTPAYATPTGACMVETRQQQLLALASVYDFAIIEDDIYGDLGFYQRPAPLKSLDTEQRVILCSSFSKSLSRDLRIGWIAAGRWQQQVARLKLVSQLAGSQSVQQALALFLAQGHYKRHLQHYRIQLQHQRDQLLQALQHYWPEVNYTVPQGGLALWLVLPESVNCTAAYRQCLQQGIVLTPGALFSSSGQFQHCLRLSFANPLLGSRLAALQTLAQLFSTESA